MAFCTNCGSNLSQGAKFCSICGNPVELVDTKKPSEERYTPQGKIMSCPNCGATINSLQAVCSYCGAYITGRGANITVQAFKEQLMEIEKTRQDSISKSMWDVLSLTPSSADTQKLTLIKNFPIPNTIEEISEFMLLAVANIDVSLSKNTFRNRINSSSGISSATISWAISNAWVAKMEQVYNKALLSFPNEPIFKNIEQVYKSKMKELKLLKK